MKTQTVAELYEYLSGLMQIGKGDLPIYFDTEARTFNYHMAQIGDAYYDKEACEAVGKEFVSLHEKSK
jgi:hypothetical protein